MKPQEALQEALEVMQSWTEQYKTDESPLEQAQVAAIAAMDVLLVGWRDGLDGEGIRVALKDTYRMLEILQAFQGRLALLDCQVNGVEDD